jgi:hypothetical protein
LEIFAFSLSHQVSLWVDIKLAPIQVVSGHLRPEIAEHFSAYLSFFGHFNCTLSAFLSSSLRDKREDELSVICLK